MFKKIIFLLILSGCILLVSCHDDSNLNYNEVVEVKYSVDNKYKAIKFVRNVSSTTAYSYHLSILPISEKFEDKPGNIYIGYVDCEYKWINKKTLVVTIKKKDVPGKIFLQKSRFADVIIEYKHDD